LNVLIILLQYRNFFRNFRVSKSRVYETNTNNISSQLRTTWCSTIATVARYIRGPFVLLAVNNQSVRLHACRFADRRCPFERSSICQPRSPYGYWPMHQYAYLPTEKSVWTPIISSIEKSVWIQTDILLNITIHGHVSIFEKFINNKPLCLKVLLKKV
jgi:hypothetical protein